MRHILVSILAVLLVAAPAALAQDKPAAAAAAAAAAGPRVALETSKGKIVVELDAVKAPKTAENFLAYVRAGFYDGTVFHRVIKGFMIQGGGFTADFQKKETRPPIVNEAKNGLSNARGTIAMARTSDPNSATAQFFINTVDNKNLDPGAFDPNGYAVFGHVVEGMDVVDAIEGVATGYKARMSDVPVETVTITKATVVE